MSPTELNLDAKKAERFKKIDAKVALRNITIGMVADFEVNFVIDLTCVRCLEIFSKAFNVTLHLNYIEGKNPFAKTEKVKLRSSDINMIYYSGSHIDASIGIREAIILSLPIAPLCKDDCLGLCPVCGNNINKKKCGCKIEKADSLAPQTVELKKQHSIQSKNSTQKKKT